MENKYDLNDLALMTGFTTRTLRNYLTQGLLEGEKENGVWQFTPEQLDRFFSEPFVKEGLRIKENSQDLCCPGPSRKPPEGRRRFRLLLQGDAGGL